MEWDWVFPPFFWPFFGIFALLALGAFAFDVWMLIDAIQRPAEHYPSPDAKTWWIVGLIVGLVTGLPAFAVALAYFFVVRKPALEGRSPARTRMESYPPPTPAGPGPAPGPPPAAPPGGPKNCQSCGAKVVAGARFCHSCGAPTQ